MAEMPGETIARAVEALHRDPERKHPWELAVADWLESWVDVVASDMGHREAEDWSHALTVARLYLGASV